MITSITWFKRRDGLSPEQFVAYWQTTHAEKVVRMPGIRHYTQNPTHPSAYRNGKEPAFDGFAEVSFDDMDAVRANGASEAYAAVREDEPNFFDVATAGSILCDTHVVVDGPHAAFKFVTLVHRRPDLPVEAFRAHWREQHGPIVATNPYIRRYVQAHVRPGIYRSGRQPDADGMAMTWFDSFDDMKASAATPALAATRADEANFLRDEGRGLPFVVCTEHVVIP